MNLDENMLSIIAHIVFHKSLVVCFVLSHKFMEKLSLNSVIKAS